MRNELRSLFEDHFKHSVTLELFLKIALLFGQFIRLTKNIHRPNNIVNFFFDKSYLVTLKGIAAERFGERKNDLIRQLFGLAQGFLDFNKNMDVNIWKQSIMGKYGDNDDHEYNQYGEIAKQTMVNLSIIIKNAIENCELRATQGSVNLQKDIENFYQETVPFIALNPDLRGIHARMDIVKACLEF